jgi:predicted HicB family RNase H-like nuclease
MRVRIPVDLAARLIAEAKEAGISYDLYLGRVLQEARP